MHKTPLKTRKKGSETCPMPLGVSPRPVAASPRFDEFFFEGQRKSSPKQQPSRRSAYTRKL